MAKFSEAILTQYGPLTRSTGIVPRVKTLTPSLAAPYHRLRSVANRPCAKARQHLLGTASFTQQTHVQAASDQCLQFIGNCERDSLKAHRSGSLSAHPINVTMPSDVSKGYGSLWGRTVVRFSCIWMSSGKCRPNWSSGEPRFIRAGSDPALVADDSFQLSENVYTLCPDTVVPLVESVLIKAEPS